MICLPHKKTGHCALIPFPLASCERARFLERASSFAAYIAIVDFAIDLKPVMGDNTNTDVDVATPPPPPPQALPQVSFQPHIYPQPQQISAQVTLQSPLSRRGHGPGLILVVDHYALLEASEKHLDPPPLVKWAEEGFAVCQVMVPGKVGDGGEFPLEKAMEALRGCAGCDRAKFGVICRFYYFLLRSHGL